MADIFYEYFLRPLEANGYYNPVNTAVYGILFIIAVFGIYKLLKRLDMKIDKYFFYGLLPFMFWGATTRVLKDATFAGAFQSTLFDSWLFMTPGIYLVTFMLALGSLLLGLFIQKRLKFPYWKFMLGIGIFFSLLNLALMPALNLYPLVAILGLSITLGAALFAFSYFYTKKAKNTLLSIENTGILVTHLFSAVTTTIAIYVFNYGEQHVVPNLVLPFLGIYSMVVLKVVAILPILWFIDSYSEEKDFKNWLKIVVFLLGFSQFIRDTVRLLVGV